MTTRKMMGQKTAVLAKVGDKIRCSMVLHGCQTWVATLNTPEAVAEANKLLLDKKSGFTLVGA